MTSADGRTVAAFEFPPNPAFAMDRSADTDDRSATSTIPDVGSIEVGVPSDSSYVRHHDEGGELTVGVHDGSLVTVDVVQG